MEESFLFFATPQTSGLHALNLNWLPMWVQRVESLFGMGESRYEGLVGARSERGAEGSPLICLVLWIDAH